MLCRRTLTENQVTCLFHLLESTDIWNEVFVLVFAGRNTVTVRHFCAESGEIRVDIRQTSKDIKCYSAYFVTFRNYLLLWRYCAICVLQCVPVSTISLFKLNHSITSWSLWHLSGQFIHNWLTEMNMYFLCNILASQRFVKHDTNQIVTTNR